MWNQLLVEKAGNRWEAHSRWGRETVMFAGAPGSTRAHTCVCVCVFVWGCACVCDIKYYIVIFQLIFHMNKNAINDTTDNKNKHLNYSNSSPTKEGRKVIMCGSPKSSLQLRRRRCWERDHLMKWSKIMLCAICLSCFFVFPWLKHPYFWFLLQPFVCLGAIWSTDIATSLTSASKQEFSSVTG